MVGNEMFEADIRAYLDELKEKYNGKIDDVGLDYHIEATKIDYGVAVFVVLKLTDIQLKKFVFRFRKAKGIQVGVEPLNLGGLVNPNTGV